MLDQMFNKGGRESKAKTYFYYQCINPHIGQPVRTKWLGGVVLYIPKLRIKEKRVNHYLPIVFLFDNSYLLRVVVQSTMSVIASSERNLLTALNFSFGVCS